LELFYWDDSLTTLTLLDFGALLVFELCVERFANGEMPKCSIGKQGECCMAGVPGKKVLKQRFYLKYGVTLPFEMVMETRSRPKMSQIGG
jgi:hypothetical protein